MSRQTHFSWLSHLESLPHRFTAGRRVDCPTRRPLRFELLEDRRLLAITVSTLVDELDGSIVDGDVSLRDAISAAPVGETISFSVTGAINLSLGQLTINKNFTVTGPGANLLTINAGGASRVLDITGGTVNVSGLTLTGGNADRGGGVRNVFPATTTLTNVAIQGNTATAALDPVNVDAGAGVWNTGTLTITSSTISGNQAPNSGGGGVWSSGALAMTQCTVSGNSARYYGGGIFAHGGTAAISHSTITGNSVFGFGHGAGIKSSFSATTINHSIISGNAGSEIHKSYGTVYLTGHNVLGDSSKTSIEEFFLAFTIGTNILATSDSAHPAALNEILAPLADNGGPTRTHVITIGSPAFQAGDPAFSTPPNFDQRGAGFSRVAGGRIDIGAFELQTLPAALVVDSLADESDGDYSAGDLSLREALLLADTFAGADTVSFAAGLAGVITLNQGQLAIRSDVTLTGPGANLLTINGNDASRIFDVNDQSPDVSSVRAVSISGLTLADGSVASYHGGAILNGENLTITGCTIRDNSTGFSGGGIFNIGAGSALTVQNSTISGNVALGDGGGIASHGALSVQNSTLSRNDAHGSGGGIASFGNSVFVQNCTITTNLADANMDPQGTGGGIWFVNTAVVLHNTIVSHNYESTRNPPVGPDFYNDIVAFNGQVDAGSSHNLIGIPSGGLTSANGNQLGVNNPGLGPLADNGGPTLTHAILPLSPAFNAGNNAQAAGSTDQRGGAFARVVDGTVDIGAVESQLLNLVVDTDVDEDDGNYAPGDLSLREAINRSSAGAGADVITFSSFFNTPRTITLIQGQLELESDLSINGPSAGLLTVDGDDASPVLAVEDGLTVAISGMTITGGRSFWGGGILNRQNSNLTITDCTVRDNVANRGGGIANLGGVLTLQRSTISGNAAIFNFPNDGEGGGIFSRYGGVLYIENSTISGNSAERKGGGVFAKGTGVRVKNSTISGNSAGIQGGGIYHETYSSSHSTIGHSLVAGNTVPGTIEVDEMIGFLSYGHNLFGDSSKTTAQSFLITSLHPTDILATSDGTLPTALSAILAPLADYGGPTLTHALVRGSPAIDAGYPVFTPPPEFDQRGAPFARDSNGRIDIGAYELQAQSADFGGDDDVNGFDFLAWQRGFGTTVGAMRAQGNADDDGDVDGADLAVWKSTFGNSAPPPGDGNGLLGAYFNNVDLTAPVFERTDPTVNFLWGTGSPDTAIGADTFSVRWTGQVEAQFTETFTFRTTSDDGVRLWINNQLMIDQWNDHGATHHFGTIALAAGQRYDVRMEYYERFGAAVAWLAWSSPSQPIQIIPQSQLYSDPPALVAAAAPAASAARVAGDSPSRLSPQAVDAAMAWQMSAEAPASRPLFRPRWLRAR